MTPKERFDHLKKISKRYCLIRGYCIVRKVNDAFLIEDIREGWFAEVVGEFDHWLIVEAFGEGWIHESGLPVTQPGFYHFEALLYHSPEQRGDYPPPNIECREYMEIVYIEYQLDRTFEQEEAAREERRTYEGLDLPF